MEYDVTIVGWCSGSDGIGRHFYAFAEALAGDLKVNCALTSPSRKEGCSPAVEKVLAEDQAAAGQVAVFVDTLWLPHDGYIGYRKTPSKSRVKIAYLVCESSSIPPEWVKILNDHFDAGAVPDDFCKEVFLRSGVRLPVFVLPLNLDLHPFLARPPKETPNIPFVFGNTLFLSDRKNQLLLAKAFLEAFGDCPDVKLRLSSKFFEPDVYASLMLFIEESKASNIELALSRLSSDAYVDFMASLDCYVSFSKGEGFAIPPREALALGIPCILTDNTAQATLCKTGFVRSVASSQEEPAWSETLFRYEGNWSSPSIEDAADALKDVYGNYELYLEKARRGRDWVRGFLPQELKGRYLSLVKPRKVVLGDRDELANDRITTTSKIFYDLIISGK